MSEMWLILIALVIIWIAPIPFMVRSEKKKYNNGKCPKCGHEWRCFDNDHTGAVGLICDSCGNVMWLDWCRTKMDKYWKSVTAYRRARSAVKIAAIAVLSSAAVAIALLIGTIWKQVREDKPAPVEVCTVDEWVASHTTAPEQPEEDPMETEHINAALFRMGYLREDVPLSVGDQLSLRAKNIE